MAQIHSVCFNINIRLKNGIIEVKRKTYGRNYLGVTQTGGIILGIHKTKWIISNFDEADEIRTYFHIIK